MLRSGDRVGYDYLIVAPGIKLNWDQIKGLSEAELGRNGICSNYLYEECEGTWRTLQEFQGGTAIFTMPLPPIKCAGAPQKIMYLADDHFRKRGICDRTKIIYAAATPGIFAVKEFAKTLKPGDRPQGDRDPLQAHPRRDPPRATPGGLSGRRARGRGRARLRHDPPGAAPGAATGYGKLVLAEFDYDLKPAPSFPFDTTKERRSMYQLKRYGLPALYWRGMLKGRA